MKHTLKKLLALSLALMLLLSGVALAEKPKMDNLGIDISDLGTGVIINQLPEIGLDASQDSASSDKSVEGTNIGVKADNGNTATVTGDATGGNTGVYADNSSTGNVTGNVTSTNGTGVIAKGGSDVTVGTEATKDDPDVGNVTGSEMGVFAYGENTQVTVYGDATAKGSSYSAGVKAEDGSKVTVEGDVKADYEYGSNNMGVSASGAGTEVTVKGNVKETGGYGGSGIEALDGSTVTVGTEATKDDETVGNVTGSETGVVAYGENTQVTVYGSVTGKDTGVNASGKDTKVTVTGGVTATSEYGTGVNASNGGKITVGTLETKDDKEVGNVTGGNMGVVASGENAEVIVYGNVTGKSSYGVEAMDGSAVYVTGKVSGESEGIYTYDSTVTVDGDVTSTKSTGIYASNSNVTVHGGVEGTNIRGVTAARTSTITVDEGVKGGKTGVSAIDDADVTVGGDVEATGDGGIGLQLQGKYATAQAQEGENGINIIVGGTVSGQDAALEVVGSSYGMARNTDNVNVTAWALESEGELVRVVDRSRQGGEDVSETNAEASEAFTKTINYIIKTVGDGIASAMVTEDQNVVVGGSTYYTAHEGEKVKLAVKLGEDEALDGVYYDGSDESTLTKTAALEKDETSGNFLIGMLRGGGMLLRLATHKHTAGDATKEKVVAATCQKAGSYEEVKKCSVCGVEMSRTTKTIEKLAHTAGAAVKENEVAATCKAAGSYDEVVYCSVCNTQISRTAKTIEKLAHTPAAAVQENVVAATCKAAGSYDEVVYCKVCEAEISRKAVTVDKLAHTPAKAVQENVVAATCKAAGSYDEVVYCAVCETELSRKAVTVDKLAHTPAEAVEENRVEAKPGAKGSYDKVVYCEVCKAELSREKVEIPALPVEEDPAEPPADNSGNEDADDPGDEDTDGPQMEFVYVPVDENTEVNGVKAADQPPMAEALATVGETLDGEQVTVEVVDAEKLMDAAQLERFDNLSVKDRLLVTLSALGFGDALGEASADMSQDARQLAEDIAARLDGMGEAEKQALLASLFGHFLPRLIVIDGQEYESVGIEVVIDRNGEKTYERYTFYNDNGQWKLWQIERGAYVVVGE